MAIFIFFLGTLVFAYFSWRYAVFNPRRQGPYRFVVFEGILALALMNEGAWFNAPASPVQIVSWIAFALSIFLAIAGFTLLRNRGGPQGHFECTTLLVTDGVYRYIRHPMYASLFLLATGVALKQPTYWPAIVVLAIVVVAVYLTAKAEEQGTLEAFGAAYAAYMKTSKMFIPFVV
ncbi:MAG: isoprenylcysteine carboxylmethyltransferase family protein [Roseiarcus sp.]|jgi:protein-S-isoprenylcysteine O-methyltransferase Ste14